MSSNTEHCKQTQSVPVVLSIAGSDSGGGAGLQADLKVFSSLGVFGTTAVTCVTAQNPDVIRAVQAVDSDMVSLQIETVLSGVDVAAVKTGMLYSVANIKAVASTLRRFNVERLVVDPVMIATSGSTLLCDDAIAVLCDELISMSFIVTPNLPEAEVLCNQRIESVSDLKDAAVLIGNKFNTSCVVKGGHLAREKSSDVVDVLYTNDKVETFSSARVAVKETHGTGCCFSSALTANLAKGVDLVCAVRAAKLYVSTSLQNAKLAGGHYPIIF